MDGLHILLTIIGSVVASSGFWAFIQARGNRTNTQIKLLIGLAHDRIVYLGMNYIERGYITRDEYENLHDYLYVPYHDLGGNGTAGRVMEQVDRLPIRN